jgi:PRTRC genetic system protein B
MRFSIDVGSELELKLYQAVLLYKNDHGSRYMATVHGVVQQNGDGSPVLGPGQLLSTASLRELARQLGTGCPVEFLPDEVVARTPDLLAWWTPAAVRPMFFRAGSELESISGKRFPHPALLFVVRNSVLYVRALFANQRPGPVSKLAAAPYWNIDSLNGAVCAGTMRTPKALTVTSIAAWQQAFFQSEFTHPGGGGRLTKRRGGTTALGKGLAGREQFPLSTLIEAESLEKYLKRLETERR